MINLRIIARILGLVLVIEGLFMLVPFLVSLIYREEVASSFLYSALITIVSGIMVFSPLRKEEKLYGNREGYIIVTFIWILFVLFSTLPWIISGTLHSFGDALFESVAGFTTTAASVITDVEALPKGLLFWRSLTQWLGGAGIIIISLAVLPVVKSVNIQLTATEFSGQQADKIKPRMADAAKRLMAIYLGLTLAETVLLVVGGAGVFDAVCHSLSTISSGGFSTKNDGIAAFATPYMKVVLTIFMFFAGTNFTILYFAVKGNVRKIRENNEFIFYAITTVIFIAVISFLLFLNNGFNAGKAIGEGIFQVVSLVTTTGFYSDNFNLWSNSLIILLFTLMFTGGMAGSTSGGIKAVRLLLITKNNRHEMKRLIHPNAYIPVRLDNHVVNTNSIQYLLVFIILYFITFSIGSFVLTLMDYDIITSFSTSASMLANIGPSIGEFGPAGNYSLMPMQGKMFLAFLMLLGRLEMVSVIILLSRGFYRR